MKHPWDTIIGVGCAIGAVLICLLILWLHSRYRASKLDDNPKE